jgi:hypothetical protein
MRRTAIASVTLIVLLVIGSAAASTASAKRLVLGEAGTALAPADAFEIDGRHNLAVTTSSGYVECEDFFNETGLEVIVVKNSRATDELEINRIFGEVQEPPCRSFTGNVFVDLESLEGPLKLGANGKASTGAVELLISFEHIEYRGVRSEADCVYSHNHLTGSDGATPTPEKLEIDLGAKLRLDVARSSVNAKHFCPKTAEMELSLPFTENEAGESETIEEQAT